MDVLQRGITAKNQQSITSCYATSHLFFLFFLFFIFIKHADVKMLQVHRIMLAIIQSLITLGVPPLMAVLAPSWS